MDFMPPPRPVDLRKQALKATHAEPKLASLADKDVDETLEGCSLSASCTGRDCNSSANCTTSLPSWSQYWDDSRDLVIPERCYSGLWSSLPACKPALVVLNTKPTNLHLAGAPSMFTQQGQQAQLFFVYTGEVIPGSRGHCLQHV